MSTHIVDFVADVEMVGDDPRPPVLTTAVRPNFVVGDQYCPCFIVETTPQSGISLHGKGTIRAHVVCSDEALPLFVEAGEFELRSAKRVFGKGHFREIASISDTQPTHAR